MAIYHLNCKVGSRSGGQSAKAKSDYLSREGKYTKDRDEVLSLESGNMPDWAEQDPSAYWDMADLYERANGNLFREVEFALPIELSVDQQVALAKEFQQTLTKDELPFTMAIHSGKGHNPHCHLMMSERINDGHNRDPHQWFKRAANRGLDPSTGGARKADLGRQRKVWLKETRTAWSQLANTALAKHGHAERIDHRTLAAQGFSREPGIHLGPNIVAMEQDQKQTDRADLHLGIIEENLREGLYHHDQQREFNRRRKDSASQRRRSRQRLGKGFGRAYHRLQARIGEGLERSRNQSKHIEHGIDNADPRSSQNRVGRWRRATMENLDHSSDGRRVLSVHQHGSNSRIPTLRLEASGRRKSMANLRRKMARATARGKNRDQSRDGMEAVISRNLKRDPDKVFDGRFMGVDTNTQPKRQRQQERSFGLSL